MYRVLHAPIEIAGQVGIMCRFLRQKGIPTVGYNHFQTYLNYHNGLIETDAFELQKIFEYALNYFEIFHFNYSYTFFEDHWDLPIIYDQGKKIIMHHRGGDVRFSNRARAFKNYLNPYVNTDSSFPDEMIDLNLRKFSRYVSAAIVQDYELYHYVSDYYTKVFVLPRLIDLRNKIAQYPSTQQRIPTIVHAPTDRDFKGSDVIERVIGQIKTRFPLNYLLIQNSSHEETIRHYETADIVIDQILCGAFGNVSVEAMAMGKPVVAYVREDLIPTYPGNLPIVSANPDTLESRLIELIKEPELRQELGRQGRKYVETYHSAPVVIEQLIEIYRQVFDSS